MERGVGRKIAPPRERSRAYGNVSEASIVCEWMGAGRYVTDSRMVS